MDYQLVLQLRGDDCHDFDAMVNLEDDMQQVFEPIADVDGHDVGSGEMNIFILTADPVGTFERAKPLLSAASLLDKVGAAYRQLRSDDFTVLWPLAQQGVHGCLVRLVYCGEKFGEVDLWIETLPDSICQNGPY